MELYQLRYFQAVAEFGTLAKAAEELAVSQSAVSRAISLLEKELGVDLFTRRGRANELNPNDILVQSNQRQELLARKSYDQRLIAAGFAWRARLLRMVHRPEEALQAIQQAKGLENVLRRNLAGASFGALVDGSFLRLGTTRRNGYTVDPCTYTTLRRWWPRLRRRA